MNETLMYLGTREMNPTPVNFASVTDVARHLHQRTGRPAVVILEPGDGTRYRLCVVPCWGPGIWNELGDVGIPGHVAQDYLLVTRFDAHGGDVFFSTERVEYFDVEVQNEWSRRFLAWWLRRLWYEIVGVRAEDRAAVNEANEALDQLRKIAFPEALAPMFEPTVERAFHWDLVADRIRQQLRR